MQRSRFVCRFLKMVRASLDRQIDTTVIVASCFPLFEQVPNMQRERNRQTDEQTHVDKHTNRHSVMADRQQCLLDTHIIWWTPRWWSLCAARKGGRGQILLSSKNAGPRPRRPDPRRKNASFDHLIIPFTILMQLLSWSVIIFNHQGDFERSPTEPSLPCPGWCVATLHWSRWKVI